MKTILIIEDEEVLRSLLKDKLVQEGYNVITANDGEEGLSRMKEARPDLVILDIVMPKMGGFEVLEEVSKDPELKSISIIIVSNSGQPIELDKAQELGADDWLIKADFNPQEVVDKVRKQLGE